MNTYRVHNPVTFHEFGLYEASDPDAALDVFARDAGYRDFADACEVAGLGAVADLVDPVGDGLTPEEWDEHERGQDRRQREHDRAMDAYYS
jgi:hypothetical protein